MTTPIIDFLNSYRDLNLVRMHMPGHKGKGLHKVQNSVHTGIDITEIAGADSLYSANGIISESEKNASELFGTAATIFSAGGSSLCILAMLTMLKWCKKGKILALRNVHKSFTNAVSLLELDVEWLWPTHFDLISFQFEMSELEKKLVSGEVAAVYVTSPDYCGKTQDIVRISELCTRYGVLLMVDNAHGAHLKFLKPDSHPITLGAHICCDSAHKTLPCLTGGAYLHFSEEGKRLFLGKNADIGWAKRAMGIYGSTSPSYLILASLDSCNAFLEERGEKSALEMAENRIQLADSIKDVWPVMDTEPSKLTIETWKIGADGEEMAEKLRNLGVECEYADKERLVLMFSLATDSSDFAALKAALLDDSMVKLANKNSNKLVKKEKFIFPAPPVQVMSMREATFLPQERISVEDALGRVCGVTEISCPPGVPILCAGERVDEEWIKILKRYSIFEINVVK